MPWDAKSIKKHNRSLSPGEAKKAAAQSSAMLAAGASEGVALATSFKRVNKLRKRGMISDRAAERMPKKAKTAGNEIDAATA
jgi:hypothetical protein